MDPLSLLRDKKKSEPSNQTSFAPPKAVASAAASPLADLSTASASRQRSSVALAASFGSAPSTTSGSAGYPAAPPAQPPAPAASAPLTGVADFIGTAGRPPSLGPSSLSSAGSVTFEDILLGEKVHVVASNCFLLVRNPLCEVGGRLLVTNFRLKFQTPKGTLREELRWMLESRYFDVPMGAVEELKEERATSVTGALELRVSVQTKDFRSLTLLMRNEDDCRAVLDAVSAFGTPGNPTLLFAFKHAEEVRRASGPEDPDGWSLYDPVREYTRMGIETEIIPSPASPWVVSGINAQYSLCSSYPALLALPRRMTDYELRAVAAHRKRGRLPAMSWCGGPELHYASLWRCSQTTEGMLGIIGQKCCVEDQKMVEVIRRGPNAQAERDLLVIDLRPWKSAWANKAGGGGFEGYPRCKLVFGNIDNIHCVREAWRAMGKAVNAVVEGEAGTWMKDVANSCWYDYMGAILNSTKMVVTELLHFKSSVLVHCSDGWDRTAEVASLAMLCLDASYRTQEGLLRLVQKEWCSFGHRFRTRLALGEVPSGEYSPVFIQWLDCVYQLFRQFPSAFEWTPNVLLRLAQEAVSNRYGTFLCDNEQERAEKIRPYAMSFWSVLLKADEASTWFNWDYQPTSKALIPNICQANYVIWDAYWFRHHVRGSQLRGSTDGARTASSLSGTAAAAAAAPAAAAALPPAAAPAPPPPVPEAPPAATMMATPPAAAVAAPQPAPPPEPGKLPATANGASDRVASLFSEPELRAAAAPAPPRSDRVASLFSEQDLDPAPAAAHSGPGKVASLFSEQELEVAASAAPATSGKVASLFSEQETDVAATAAPATSGKVASLFSEQDPNVAAAAAPATPGKVASLFSEPESNVAAAAAPATSGKEVSLFSEQGTDVAATAAPATSGKVAGLFSEQERDVAAATTAPAGSDKVASSFAEQEQDAATAAAAPTRSDKVASLFAEQEHDVVAPAAPVTSGKEASATVEQERDAAAAAAPPDSNKAASLFAEQEHDAAAVAVPASTDKEASPTSEQALDAAAAAEPLTCVEEASPIAEQDRALAADTALPSSDKVAGLLAEQEGDASAAAAPASSGKEASLFAVQEHDSATAAAAVPPSSDKVPSLLAEQELDSGASAAPASSGKPNSLFAEQELDLAASAAPPSSGKPNSLFPGQDLEAPTGAEMPSAAAQLPGASAEPAKPTEPADLPSTDEVGAAAGAAGAAAEPDKPAALSSDDLLEEAIPPAEPAAAAATEAPAAAEVAATPAPAPKVKGLFGDDDEEDVLATPGLAKKHRPG